ncbi:MAG TPA: tetratricopeptide repeat protein [Roseiarcus sp.]|nr:tetratricopeptide repeat protein [Roseiarcus sp.]
MDTLQGVNWAEVLSRLSGIEGKIDRNKSEAERRRRESEEAAERRSRENLAATEASRRETEALRLEIARENGVSAEVLKPLFDHLGMSGLSVLQMRERGEEAIAAILARASERVAPSNLGPDIDAIIAAARAKLAALDTAGAESILDGQIEEEEATFRRRQVPLLAEKAAVQRLSYNHEGAKGTLRRLLNVDPDQTWRWIDLGDICRTTGSLDEALGCYRSAAEAAERTGDERALSVSCDGIGDVLVRQRNLTEALNSYQAALAIRQRLADADPGNSDWQGDLSVSNDRIGDVLARQQNWSEAVKYYAAAFAIRRSLARADPDNLDWLRNLSISNDRIGDALVSQGILSPKRSESYQEALESYQAGLAIRQHLTRTVPNNSGWKRDLSISHEKIGDVLV